MKTFRETVKPSDLSLLRQRIVGINTKVPLFNGTLSPYIFLDNAASTPVLTDVLDTVNDFMPWYSSVHRGSGLKSRIATEAYEQARSTVAEFFGANNSDHLVIFGKNTTEAINKLSYRLQLSKKDVVLISLLEHHSNDLPWRQVAQVRRIKVDHEGNLIEEDLERLLEKFKGRVKLVAISGGSNVTGYIPDIYGIAKKVHAAGARILVDCAQLAPHRRVQMKELDDPEHLDYIAVSAHKMYAPFGTGALIGRRDTFESGIPELCGGGTIDVVTTKQVEWTAPPDREEAGTPNIVGAVAFAKALKLLSSAGMDKIAAHEAELTGYALEKLNKITGLTVFGDTDPSLASSRLGVIPFKVNKMPHGLVGEILSTEWGIGVRSGCFCAHPYVTHLLDVSRQGLERFRTEVLDGDRSNMPGVARVSFGMYNTKAEIDVLAEALNKITTGEYEGTYRQEKSTGNFYALGWEPDLSRFFKL
ncbi:aminotransferase class V-fold PLP-dependent enzyme [Candidatus Saccharibacteria bacterium]|nr:aminotransferase class V-fold PLP-dependent enzyme [Candidatus Saccharibacteria bacterium]